MAVVAAALVGLAGVWAGLRMAGASPVWWRSVRASDPRTAEASAGFERVLLEEFTRVRAVSVRDASGRGESEAWALAVTPQAANAWLNVGFPAWVASALADEAGGGAGSESGGGAALPESVRDLQVSFEAGRVHVGLELDRGGTRRVYSAQFRTRLDEVGRLWLVAEGLSVGRLTLPASWAMGAAEGLAASLAEQGVPEQHTRAFVAILRGERPALEEPVASIGDGRRVRLVGLQAERGRLVAVFRTEVPGPAVRP